MEEVNILYSDEVTDYLNRLSLVLFKKEYFGFLDSFIIYKDKIIEFIDNNIETFLARKIPIKLDYLGSYYFFYKSNQRTTWYVFFENIDNNFLITSILNSNSIEIKDL